MDSEILAYEVEIAYLARHGLTFAREDYLSRFLGLSHAAFHDALDEEARRKLGQALPHGIRDELAETLRQTMIEKLTEVPGAAKAIAAIACPKAVASSSTKAGLERKLKQTGLWGHFAPHVYSAEHVANAKPAPDLFLHAAAALGIAPGACLAIEDSVNGVLAARSAGVPVWGFLGGGHADTALGARLAAAGASKLVNNWPELSGLLEDTVPNPDFIRS